MISQYIRMFLFFLALCGVYLAVLYFFPNVGATLDEKTGVTWNHDIRSGIFGWLEKVENAEDVLNQKLDNPAPNTSRNIEGRMGQ